MRLPRRGGWGGGRERQGRISGLPKAKIASKAKVKPKSNAITSTGRLELEQAPPKWFLDYGPKKKSAVEACFASVQDQMWAFAENEKSMMELKSKWDISSEQMGDLAIYFGAQHLKWDFLGINKDPTNLMKKSWVLG